MNLIAYVIQQRQYICPFQSGFSDAVYNHAGSKLSSPVKKSSLPIFILNYLSIVSYHANLVIAK